MVIARDAQFLQSFYGWPPEKNIKRVLKKGVSKY